MAAPETVRITAAVSRDGQWYVARALEIELASQGETIEEALANLREAAELYFEDQPTPELATPIGTLASILRQADLDVHTIRSAL